MQFNICPFCRRTLPAGEPSSGKQDILCPSCGAELCRIPNLSLAYGKRLPTTPLKKNRVACPYCNAHYSLNYEPLQGLVGCQSCLKIFVMPPEERSVQPLAEKRSLPVVPVNTGEIPVRKGVIPKISPLKNIQGTALPEQDPSSFPPPDLEKPEEDIILLSPGRK